MKNPTLPQFPTVFLKPGEIHIAQSPQLVITVLGSCVSVTMYDRTTRTGAICHALLPQTRADRCCIRPSSDFRYVDDSIYWMLRQLEKHGIDRGGIEIKLFGGAEVLIPRIDNSGAGSVGRQNIDAAVRTLQTLGLNPTVSVTGGCLGRKIYFYTHTGEILLRRLGKGILHQAEAPG